MIIKILLKHSAYGIPLIMILSIIPQFFFFSLFNIDLGSYISLVEIPVLFIKNFILILIVYLIPYVFLASLFGKKIGAENNNFIKIISTSPLKVRLKYYFIDNLSFIILISIYLIVSYINKDHNWALIAFAWILLMIFNTFMKEVIIRNNITLDIEVATALNALHLVFSLLMIFLLIAYFDANKIKKDREARFVTISTEQRNIYCKYTLRYIGRTSNYTFIYNKKQNRTEVIKNSDIVKEIFESK